MTGNYTNSATVAGLCVTGNVSGNISNTGTISPGGISFTGGTLTGGINSSGTIIGGISLDQASKIKYTGGDAVDIHGSTFSGGISNAGTISASQVGLDIYTVSTYSGGISNTGTISAGSYGIFFDVIGTLSGGISNAGTISAGAIGIVLQNVSDFSGGISNSGAISLDHYGIFVDGVSTFSGGISRNSRTISAARTTAIAVFSVSTFSGGISNSGTISARHSGYHSCQWCEHVFRRNQQHRNHLRQRPHHLSAKQRGQHFRFRHPGHSDGTPLVSRAMRPATPSRWAAATASPAVCLPGQ